MLAVGCVSLLFHDSAMFCFPSPQKRPDSALFFFCVTNLTFFFHKLNYFLKSGGSLGKSGKRKGVHRYVCLNYYASFFFVVAVLTKKERAPHNQPTTTQKQQQQLVEQHTVKHAALAFALEIVQQLVDVVVQVVTLGHHRY